MSPGSLRVFQVTRTREGPTKGGPWDSTEPARPDRASHRTGYRREPRNSPKKDRVLFQNPAQAEGLNYQQVCSLTALFSADLLRCRGLHVTLKLQSGAMHQRRSGPLVVDGAEALPLLRAAQGDQRRALN